MGFYPPLCYTDCNIWDKMKRMLWIVQLLLLLNSCHLSFNIFVASNIFALKNTIFLKSGLSSVKNEWPDMSHFCEKTNEQKNPNQNQSLGWGLFFNERL